MALGHLMVNDAAYQQDAERRSGDRATTAQHQKQGHGHRGSAPTPNADRRAGCFIAVSRASVVS
jgi:hypothetical protein